MVVVLVVIMMMMIDKISALRNCNKTVCEGPSWWVNSPQLGK